MAQRLTRSLVACACLSLAAVGCGGGGGGGSAPPPNPPPPPPPPRLSLAFNAANAQDGATVAMALMESMLQLSGLASTAIQQAVDSDALQFTVSCDNGGLADFDLSDLDQDGAPTPGDTLRVTYRDCDLIDLNSVAAGDLVINLANPQVAPAVDETVFAGSVDASALTILAGSGESATVSDSVSFEVRKGRLTDSLIVAGDVSIVINSAGSEVTESIQGFEFRKESSFETARYTLQAQGFVNSSIMGGTFEFDNTRTISGFLRTYPEQGRLELVGNNSRVALLPNFVTASSSVDIEVDTTANGTFVPVSEPFWSELVEGFLWWYKDADPFRYEARTFNANDFYVLLQSPQFDEEASVNTELRIQFSRPVLPSSIPAALTAIRQFDQAPFSEPIELDIELAGAALLLTPREQLKHGNRYYYPAEFFNAEDQFQNTAAVFGTGFVTPDSLSSQPAVSSALAISGDTIGLDASASFAVASEIVSYAWSQVSGTAGTINNADQMNAEFVVPQLAGAELIRLQLEVVNTEGEYDREVVEISGFDSEAAVQVIRFTGDDDDYISLGLEWLLTSANGEFFIGRNFDNGISFSHDRTDPSFDRWNLEFAAAGDAQIEVGSYENATRFPFQAIDEPGLSLFGNGRGCNTVAGRFDVLEVSYDANGDVLTAAIDFEHRCEGGAAMAVGSVRVGSALPIPGY